MGGPGSPAGGDTHAIAAATDLLEKILELDVDKRLTASQALAHPFFEPFRDPEEETEAQKFDDSFEHEKLTVDEWKRKSWGPGLLPLSTAASVFLASLMFAPGLSQALSLKTAASSLSGYCLLRSFLSLHADVLLHALSEGAGYRLFLALSNPYPL